MIRRINAVSKSLGFISIRIQFKLLKVVIGVPFLLRKKGVLILLSIKDIVDDVLNVPIQGT